MSILGGMSEVQSLPLERHTIFQNSLMTALLDGIYDGEMSVSELLSYGNFGIGTFDALDGEMVILDGVCYQLRGDGSAQIAELSQRSPYAVATNFVPRITAHSPVGFTRDQISKFIDQLLPSKNYMYALRISGTFRSVTVRTVTKQQKPYPPMLEAVESDAELTFHNIAGVMVGFRTPVYEKGISVPGCHVHFIDSHHTTGGHVLDFTIDEANIAICPGTDLQLRLPLSQDFSNANLDPADLDDQLHATEVKG